MKAVLSKLKGKKGEATSELIVSALVAILAIGILASAILFSVRVITTKAEETSAEKEYRGGGIVYVRWLDNSGYGIAVPNEILPAEYTEVEGEETVLYYRLAKS